MLMVFFAGGSFFDWFPLRGLTSDNWWSLSWPERILDYFWHLTLPLTAMVLSAFATTTLLTKNSFLEEIRKQYVVTARAKGLSDRKVLYGHVFRNAMLIIIAGFPAVFISVFFSGSLIIETIFSLDGLGRLAYESAIQRDYPVVFGTLYMFGLLGLIVGLRALAEGRVPPTVGLTDPVPEAEGFRFVTRSAEDVTARPLNIAQLNAFGFGGINAVAIVEAAR
jgi:microcin C transport system permease protein